MRGRLSREESEAAENLRKIWNIKKKTLSLTHAKMAKACSWRSPSSFTHYLSGLTPLNYEAIVRICNVLKVNPLDISESFVENVGGSGCFTKLESKTLITMYNNELSRSGGNKADMMNYVCKDSGLSALQVENIINNNSNAYMYGCNELYLTLSNIKQLRRIYKIDPVNPDPKNSSYWIDRCNNLSRSKQVQLKDFITILEKWP